MKWGEDKLITEEAFVGGLLGAALGLAVASLLLPGVAFRGMSAQVFGAGIDPAIWASYTNNYLLWVLTLAATSAATLAGAAVGFFLGGWQKAEWHYSGLQYLDDPDKAAAAFQASENALMSPKQAPSKKTQGERVSGLVVAGVELSRTREVGHLSMVGLPGSGKTVVINGVVHQVMQRRERIVLHDPKGDFTSWVYDPATTVLLGPWDERSRAWHIAADLRTPELATTFAGALIPEATGSGKFFSDAARELLGGLLKYYLRKHGSNWSWDTIADDLMQGGPELIKKAKLGDPNVRMLFPEPEGGELTTASKNVLQTAAASVSWILAYSSAFEIRRDDAGMLIEDELFSMQGWLAKKQDQQVQMVILNNNKNYEVRASQIFGAMVAAAANYINSSAMPEIGADETGLWVILDEYPQLGEGVSRYVQQIEELGRSRGVRVVKAVQDESQLMAQVGREKGEAQRSVQQTRIYLKMATGTASELCGKLGKRDQVRIEFPQIVGAGNKRVVKEERPVLTIEQLTGLRVLKEKGGVELIMHSDAVLGKLFQPFVPFEITRERHQKVIDSVKWERGLLDLAERAEKGLPQNREEKALPAIAASIQEQVGDETEPGSVLRKGSIFGQKAEEKDQDKGPNEDQDEYKEFDPFEGVEP